MGFFSKKYITLNDIFNSKEFASVYSKSIAIEKAINKIASTISSLEIKYYDNNLKNNSIEGTKNEMYYKLNVKPNNISNAKTFWFNAIKKLIENEELLIIEINNNLYYSYDFEYSNDILTGKKFFNIKLNSDDKNNTVLNLKKTFYSSECIYLKYENFDAINYVKTYINGLSKIVDNILLSINLSRKKNFKLRGNIGNRVLRDPKTGKDINIDKYVSKLTNNFTEDAKTNLFLLPEIFDIEELSSKNVTSISDYEELDKKINKDVAEVFSIPYEIYSSEIKEKSDAFNYYITNCINPIINQIEKELNSKLHNKKNYLKGFYFKYFTTNIKHIDILDKASNIDKLFATSWSRNEINSLNGLPQINEEWANKHNITKNYSDEQIVEKGGDE